MWFKCQRGMWFMQSRSCPLILMEQFLCLEFSNVQWKIFQPSARVWSRREFINHWLKSLEMLVTLMGQKFWDVLKDQGTYTQFAGYLWQTRNPLCLFQRLLNCAMYSESKYCSKTNRIFDFQGFQVMSAEGLFCTSIQEGIYWCKMPVVLKRNIKCLRKRCWAHAFPHILPTLVPTWYPTTLPVLVGNGFKR